MAYFSRFPIIAKYTFGDKDIDCVDITKRTIIARITKDDPRTYIEHEIVDGETPMILADRMYDDVDLYWVIMFYNNIYDEISDWPMTEAELVSYVNRVYGSLNGIHHYESLSTGAWVDSNHAEYDRIAITNYEYESRINDKKRLIKVPVPEIVGKIKAEHNRLIKQ